MSGGSVWGGPPWRSLISNPPNLVNARRRATTRRSTAHDRGCDGRLNPFADKWLRIRFFFSYGDRLDGTRFRSDATTRSGKLSTEKTVPNLYHSRYVQRGKVSASGEGNYRWHYGGISRRKYGAKRRCATLTRIRRRVAAIEQRGEE